MQAQSGLDGWREDVVRAQEECVAENREERGRNRYSYIKPRRFSYRRAAVRQTRAPLLSSRAAS